VGRRVLTRRPAGILSRVEGSMVVVVLGLGLCFRLFCVDRYNVMRNGIFGIKDSKKAGAGAGIYRIRHLKDTVLDAGSNELKRKFQMSMIP
jgi:hypothetical protein